MTHDILTADKISSVEAKRQILRDHLLPMQGQGQDRFRAAAMAQACDCGRSVRGMSKIKQKPVAPMTVAEAREILQLADAYMQIHGVCSRYLFERSKTAAARLEMHRLGIRPDDSWVDEVAEIPREMITRRGPPVEVQGEGWRPIIGKEESGDE